MMDKIIDTDRRFCSMLFDVLEAKGVKDVVCSPGSRNAPLLIACAARENFRKHIAIDERSGAFMALGLSSVSQSPVALVCTSGTALLNYAPAVAEAFYQNVPLIVISADRPLQWIDQDDSQTLRQFEAFSNFVKGSYELPSWGNDDPELLWYTNRIANDAMIVALSGRKGPVHINVRLGEPLGRKIETERKSPRIIEMLSSDGIINREILKKLARTLSVSKVLFVAGYMPPDAQLHKSVTEFCSLPNVVPMTETISNLHLGGDSMMIDSVLTAYDDETLDNLAPDVVVSVGGALVSRKLKEYLRRNSARCQHWSIGWNHTTSDCFMSLTKRIEADPARLLYQLTMATRRLDPWRGAACNYRSDWYVLKSNADTAKFMFTKEMPWSELKAYHIIIKNIPRRANLFLSNGTAIRYAQILGYNEPHASYCNRGVSGIDGSTSTAIGGAKAYKGPTILLSGDMSMAYDVGALALPDIPDTMKIIVIDNSGGGIFRFIPTTRHLEERDKYFTCSPHLPLRQLADGYGWKYLEATNEKELESGLRKLINSEEKTIMRVICDGDFSALVLLDYMAVKVI